MHEFVRMFVTQFSAFAPLVLAINFIERVMLLGVGNGAVASAYLAVAGAAPRAGSSAGPPPTAEKRTEPGFGSGSGA
jgi:hypothetical protein